MNLFDHGADEAARHGVGGRSEHWRAALQIHYSHEAACLVTGGEDQREGHHEIPYHLCVLLGRPELELWVGYEDGGVWRPGNVVTLSNAPEFRIHEYYGHAGDWRSGNLDARADAAARRFGGTAAEIAANPAYMRMAATRLAPWDKMAPQAKVDLRALMDRRFPIALVKANMDPKWWDDVHAAA